MAEPTRDPDIGRRINEHLEAIDRALAARGMMLTERQSITGDVEAQIQDMLAERSGGMPTAYDVEAVLRGLDPPEFYAESPEPASGARVAARTPAEQPRIPPTLWVSVIAIAVYSLAVLLGAMRRNPFVAVSAAVINVALVVGLLRARKWAYVLVLVFSGLGTALAFASSFADGVGVLIADALVVVPLLMSTRFFFPGVGHEVPRDPS